MSTTLGGRRAARPHVERGCRATNHIRRQGGCLHLPHLRWIEVREVVWRECPGHPNEAAVGEHLPYRRGDRPLRAFGNLAIGVLDEVRHIRVTARRNPRCCEDRQTRTDPSRRRYRSHEASQGGHRNEIHTRNSDQADDRRQRHVCAHGGTHHAHIADDSQQRIGQESANDAEENDVDDRVEAAHCCEAHERARDRPCSNRSARGDDQQQAGSRPTHGGKQHIDVRDRQDRAHVIEQPVTRRYTEVVGLDGDERHPEHHRSPEQLSGAGGARVPAGSSVECASHQCKYRVEYGSRTSKIARPQA